MCVYLQNQAEGQLNSVKPKHNKTEQQHTNKSSTREKWWGLLTDLMMTWHQLPVVSESGRQMSRLQSGHTLIQENELSIEEGTFELTKEDRVVARVR